MSWQQVQCQSDQAQQDLICQLLEAADPASITFNDAADQALLEPLPGETPLWDKLIITALYPAQQDLSGLMQKLGFLASQSLLSNLHLENLAEREWVREWMDQFHPIQFGQKLWVCPSWHEPPQPDAINIILDPGLAFGTGTHPTTALCLQWIDGIDFEGKTVLDYGCGSGILAIAACLLGASKVIATDIDPQATLATQNNAQRNGISDQQLNNIVFSEFQTPSCDIVMANILAGPLIELAPMLMSALKPDGLLLLSGLLLKQKFEVIDTYEKLGLTNISIQQDEEWLRISGTHSPLVR